VPQRNKNFTGREDLLRRLRNRVTAEVTALLPHTLQGLGGVGKTQLAIEYAYRYSGEYDVVWWIPSDQDALVRSTLAALAPRLGLTGIAPGRVDDTARAVLDALRRGSPYDRWLLIFDNADQPEAIRALIPHGPGHVLVTSRNHRWQSMADTLEVDVFARPESLEFLHRRVPAIQDAEAGRLAHELGDLPLALEQAGALMAETAMPVDTYLDLLGKQASKILEENPPSDYSVSVAAAWGLSVAQLREQTPYAMDLLRRCAYFGPEPISMDLLNRGRYVLGPPLRETLSDPILVSRAVRELGRYALARIDNSRKTLQVHRLVQRLIRDDISPEQGATMRHEVHLLLAASDPGEPEEFENGPKYADLFAHMGPAGVAECSQPEARQLTLNMARYLFTTGNWTTALGFINRALELWTADSGTDHRDVLVMSKHKADVLRGLGQYTDAYELSRTTLETMRAVLGPQHEETLMALNGYGGDLRSRGRFAEARALDEESLAMHQRVFTKDHRRTFMAANNLALDYSLTSDYDAARKLDEQNYHDRRDFFGEDDSVDTLRSLGALARDLRQLGRYAESQVASEQTYEAYQALVQGGKLRANHPLVLSQTKDLAVARRKAGDFAGALTLARDVYDRYRDRFGENHLDTLAAAINLGNAQRLAGQFEAAAERIEETARRYRQVLGPGHPFTHGSALNLAIVRRQQGNAARAKTLLQEAVEGLNNTVGPDHHYTLTCATNLASAMADLGEAEDAHRVGTEALQRFREVLGENHPHTLACAANLSLDLRTLGETQAADELIRDTLDRYRRTLGEDHPDTQDAAAGRRLDFDFEPPPL
jgi:tetratricopeptide (TPR) repeat protein